MKNTHIEKAYRNLQQQSILNDRARADLYYENAEEHVVIEFKYHKHVSTSTTDKTGRFGNVLRDLNRLFTLKQLRGKYLIYVCDEEMKAYYDKNWNTKKELEFLFSGNAKVGNTYTINGNIDKLPLPKLARENAFSSFQASSLCTTFASLTYDVKVLYNQQIKGTDFYILILQVI